MGKINNMFLWLVGFAILLLLIISPQKIKQTLFTTEQLPLAGQVIVLDPGHGGPDGGAVAKDKEKTTEKVISLEVAKMTRQYLEQAGAIVYLTRETDVDLADEFTKGIANRKSEDIRRRLQFIHDKEADFFISIHLNSLPSARWRGAQTFFYPRFPENIQLARTIQDELVENMENTERQALQLNTIYLLKYAKVPGALVEIGFLSNEAERELLKQRSYQQQIAASIYKGVLRYLESPPDMEEET
ncbi:MAG TPA: N-acetylmuramoyl-L-alanine amidase CwlD [Pseudogracilibacillus sp.]|nr:N-acetylmuramoyl-L-alanine amidase CwlD [Pseudogracilibacillus sp.]